MLEWTGLTPREKLFLTADKKKEKTGGTKTQPDPPGDQGNKQQKRTKQKAGKGQSTLSSFLFSAHSSVLKST